MNGVTNVDKTVSTKPSRAAKMPGGAELGKDRSAAAKRLPAAIHEVLAGARTPAHAADALSLSVPRYYQRSSRGPCTACSRPTSRGPSDFSRTPPAR